MAGQLLYVGKEEKNMAKANVNFTKDNEYYTPKKVVDYFGEFDYDPATTKEKAEEFNLKFYDTIETDGLTTDWTLFKKIWINPPFTIKHIFLEKAYETYKKCKNEIYILFPIEFLTTKRFHDITKDCGGKIYIPNGRIKEFISFFENKRRMALALEDKNEADPKMIEFSRQLQQGADKKMSLESRYNIMREYLSIFLSE